MKRGPKPKPTVVKIREGNPGKRAIKKGEPKPPKGDANLPDEFKISRAVSREDADGWQAPQSAVEAAKEFKRLSAELKTQGLFTTLDVSAVKAYCQAYGLHKEASAYVNKFGMVTQTANGNLIQNPYLAIVNKQATIMLKIAAEFGMTPSSRSRLDVSGEASKDLMEEYLNRRKKA